MVILSKIYTRTGDHGSTRLVDNSVTAKSDLRVEAYGLIDQANASIGLAIALDTTTKVLSREVREALGIIQNELFDVGADPSLPLRASYEYEPLRVTQEWIDDLEADCDRFNEGLPTLRSFILPGGGAFSDHLHVARTVARRAERAAWTAVAVHGTDPAQEGAEKGTGGVSVLPGKYLNRLSDLLFILARSAAGAEGDVLWEPGGGRNQQPERRRGTRQEG